MGEQYSYYPLAYTRAKGIFPAYRQGGRSRTMRESCYCQKVAIGLDGRPSRPATDGKPCAAGKVATAARFFSITKESTLPCKHTAPYARSACSGRQVTPIEETAPKPLEPL